MKTRTKVIIGVVAALAVVGAGTGIALTASAPEEATVLTESAQIRDVDVTVAASGTVDPALELGLQFSGFATAELATLEVEVGDVVAEGDVLATLVTESLEAAVASARSGVASARTAELQALQALETAEQAVIAARLNYENIYDDYPSTIAGQPNRHIALENAQAQQASAAAQLTAAQQQVAAAGPAKSSAAAQLDSALANLENASLIAPAAGTIVAIASEVGEPIGTTSVGTNGTSGFIILAGLEEFVVRADFAEGDVVGIAPGQKVSLEFDALPDDSREGEVTEVAPFGVVDPSGASLTTYEVTISVPNAPAGLRAGMTAQASITTEEQLGVVAAPVTALVPTEDGFVVRVQAEDGTISNVPVEVGIRGGYWVEIVSGLSEGDRVVTGSDGELPPTDTGFGGGRPEGAEENPDLN
ncbi:MAG: efflux RND transporter periplasmic adaptor subunit [Pontimonas sp.]